MLKHPKGKSYNSLEKTSEWILSVLVWDTHLAVQLCLLSLFKASLSHCAINRKLIAWTSICWWTQFYLHFHSTGLSYMRVQRLPLLAGPLRRPAICKGLLINHLNHTEQSDLTSSKSQPTILSNPRTEVRNRWWMVFLIWLIQFQKAGIQNVHTVVSPSAGQSRETLLSERKQNRRGIKASAVFGVRLCLHCSLSLGSILTR